MGPLVALLECPKAEIVVQAAAALWNLALNGPFLISSIGPCEIFCFSHFCADQNKLVIARSGGLPRLFGLTRSSNADVKYYARGALNALGIELEPA